MQMRKQHIPWLMATGRALLGPVLVIGEKCGWNGFTLAALIVTALLSDIFDGIRPGGGIAIPPASGCSIPWRTRSSMPSSWSRYGSEGPQCGRAVVRQC